MMACMVSSQAASQMLALMNVLTMKQQAIWTFTARTQARLALVVRGPKLKGQAEANLPEGQVPKFAEVALIRTGANFTGVSDAQHWGT